MAVPGVRAPSVTLVTTLVDAMSKGFVGGSEVCQGQSAEGLQLRFG
jgi:hypothetical protein